MASALVSCVALLLVILPGVHPALQAGTSSCATDLFRLLPCLSYIDGAAAAPADTCCANLGSMMHDEPQCLCQALSQPSAAPVAVNMSRVLGMPRLCRLDIPSAAGACVVAGLLPQPQGPSPPPPVIAPRPNSTSTAPSTRTPATPAAPYMTPSPWMSSQMPGYSRGYKVIADGFSVALGFVALVSVLAF